MGFAYASLTTKYTKFYLPAEGRHGRGRARRFNRQVRQGFRNCAELDLCDLSPSEWPGWAGVTLCDLCGEICAQPPWTFV